MLDAETEDPATQCKADDFAPRHDGAADQAMIGEAIAHRHREDFAGLAEQKSGKLPLRELSPRRVELSRALEQFLHPSERRADSQPFDAALYFERGEKSFFVQRARAQPFASQLSFH